MLPGHFTQHPFLSKQQHLDRPFVLMCAAHAKPGSAFYSGHMPLPYWLSLSHTNAGFCSASQVSILAGSSQRCTHLYLTSKGWAKNLWPDTHEASIIFPDYFWLRQKKEWTSFWCEPIAQIATHSTNTHKPTPPYKYAHTKPLIQTPVVDQTHQAENTHLQ